MRKTLTLIAVLASATPAFAARKPPPPPVDPAAPRELGQFEDWIAATHLEGSQTVCYALTRATSSAPAIPGHDNIVLTVSERPTGRDAVAINGGMAFPGGTEVTVQVDQAALSFYTAKKSAFARDGAAVVAAFERGKVAFARFNGPHGTPIADTFSLRGFAQAYAATVKACPVPRR